ncbi:MAG TPA: DUF4142 domain-containing protein [Gammaproteobacteria bacterium]|nr:DUF4142 domain-containing protein [Gammaproteobacteria bacterium]
MQVKNILLAVALAVPAATGFAASNTLSHQDKEWLKAAHQANLTEIKAGQAAQQQATTQVVRQAGQMLVSDHKQLDSALTRAAHDLDVSLPNSPSPTQQHLLQKVKSKSGDKFDKLWTRTMASAHLKAINKTQTEISQGSSSKVKKLAKKALPVLQTHLNMVQHAQNRVK